MWKAIITPKLLIKIQISFLLIVLLPASLEIVVAKIAKPGCKASCGDVGIPYPFGIGANCFFDPWFEIECTTTDYSNNIPFLSKFHIELLQVNLNDSSVKVNIPPLNVSRKLSGLHLRGSPYSFSSKDNVFLMEGCPGSAVLMNKNKTVMGGCGTVCQESNTEVPPSSCYGVECCQTSLPSDIQYYQIDFNSQPADEPQGCLVASLIESDSVNQYVGNLSSVSFVPVVLFWRLVSNHPPQISRYAYCDRRRYNYPSCKCRSNSGGNPYVSDGCQAPEECDGCRGNCLPRVGAAGHYCKNNLLPMLIYALLFSFDMLLLVACLYGLYWVIKRGREIKRRTGFFKRNGGLLLQQRLSSNEGFVERIKIFSISELDKATNHFNENRILGQGGQGTVYKGMLTDGSIVAIKRSKLLDVSQLEQFINEVVILSRVNHRHVVKLFGCYLETEVPLLVYEFIPNGTLFQHIHDPDEDFSFSWEMRLKTAADSASAIAYLHSYSSIPIYHRDIKSLNILLDEKHRAKVSDFGSSKTIAMDQTHLTTLVQGTMGYLDPEYFQSYQFTPKSDVYSFGVVILELLTSKKPIYRDASVGFSP